MSEDITERQRFELYVQQFNEIWLEEWVVPIGLVLQALVDRATVRGDEDAQVLADTLGALAVSCPKVAGQGLVQAMADRAKALAQSQLPSGSPPAPFAAQPQTIAHKLRVIAGGKS